MSWNGLAPNTVSEPRDGRSSPPIILISVDLPAPLGPSRPTMPPLSFQVTSDTPSTWPYHLLQLRATTTPAVIAFRASLASLLGPLVTFRASLASLLGPLTMILPRRSAAPCGPARTPARSR